MPSPWMMLPRSCVSPPPMYTTSGFDWQTASEPIDEVLILPSVIGAQFEPPSVVFHAPPPVAPNQYSSGRDSLPPTASDRPPRAGPTLRQRIPLYSEASTVPAVCADVEGSTARKPDNASPANNDIFKTFIAGSRVERRPTILSDACPRTLTTEDSELTEEIYLGGSVCSLLTYVNKLHESDGIEH